MTKQDVIVAVADKANITKKSAEEIIDAFISAITDGLKQNKKVLISGFGTFRVSHRKAREGVNPRNPTQRIKIPALKTPAFTAGKTLKDAIR